MKERELLTLMAFVWVERTEDGEKGRENFRAVMIGILIKCKERLGAERNLNGVSGEVSKGNGTE